MAQSAARGSIFVTGSAEPRSFRSIGPNLFTSTRANRARPSARIVRIDIAHSGASQSSDMLREHIVDEGLVA